MGSGSSKGAGGFRVFRLVPGGPAHEAGLEVFFDFIAEVDGTIVESDQQSFSSMIKEKEGKRVKLTVYNCRTQALRDVYVIPRSWNGQGLLGLVVKFDLIENGENQGLRVLDIQTNSPAANAGFMAFKDFIIASGDVIVRDGEDLSELVNSHVGKELSLSVYNSDTESVRELTVNPRRGWGGEGLLGFATGSGVLHRIPMARRSIIQTSDPQPLEPAPSPLVTDPTSPIEPAPTPPIPDLIPASPQSKTVPELEHNEAPTTPVRGVHADRVSDEPKEMIPSTASDHHPVVEDMIPVAATNALYSSTINRVVTPLPAIDPVVAPSPTVTAVDPVVDPLPPVNPVLDSSPKVITPLPTCEPVVVPLPQVEPTVVWLPQGEPVMVPLTKQVDPVVIPPPKVEPVVVPLTQAEPVVVTLPTVDPVLPQEAPAVLPKAEPVVVPVRQAEPVFVALQTVDPVVPQVAPVVLPKAEPVVVPLNQAEQVVVALPTLAPVLPQAEPTVVSPNVDPTTKPALYICNMIPAKTPVVLPEQHYIATPMSVAAAAPPSESSEYSQSVAEAFGLVPPSSEDRRVSDVSSAVMVEPSTGPDIAKLFE
jgi:hypothetical protein